MRSSASGSPGRGDSGIRPNRAAYNRSPGASNVIAGREYFTAKRDDNAPPKE